MLFSTHVGKLDEKSPQQKGDKMARQSRKIKRDDGERVYYLVDANFLANRHINAEKVNDGREKNQIECAKAWWKEIREQLKNDRARVYILDLCIAEAFGVLAKKYYNNEDIFSNPGSYAHAKGALTKDLTLSSKEAKKSIRSIKYHDIQTNRDIVISVDRFFEKSYKERKKFGATSIVDLMILATAKYLLDFYGLPKDRLFMVTQDKALYRLAKSYADLPMAFNPAEPRDAAEKVFI